MALTKDYPILYAEWTRLLDQKDSEASDNFYFQKILPTILPFIKLKSGKLPKYRGLISLLGFTPETVKLQQQATRRKPKAANRILSR